MWRATSRELVELAAPLWRDESTAAENGTSSSGVRVSFGRLARFLTWVARADGLTLGRWVFLSMATWGELETGSRRARVLLAHELVHVKQYRRLGWMRFLSRYLGEYFAGRRRGLPHRQAYRAISLEREARERSGLLDLAPPSQGARQGHLVGVLDVAADGHAKSEP